MIRKCGVGLLGLLVTGAIAAGIFFPLVAVHESNDVDVVRPAAPGPVILSDQFPLDDPHLLQEEIQEP